MKPLPPLLIVAHKLGPLRERVVFVGGMIRGLLTTDPAAGPARPTDDVDMIVRDVDSRSAYYVLSEELRKLGFREDTSEGAPLCRWVVEGITADVMPIDPSVLGFTNVWYESAQHYASTTSTADGPLHHLDAPHFCATKLEAFASRGAGDYYHHDLEDFVGLVDERPTLIDEIAAAPSELRAFIVERTQALLATPEFLDALPGHLSGDEVSQQRIPALRAKLQRIAGLIAPTKPVASSRSTSQSTRSPLSTLSPATGRIPVQSSNLAWVEYDSLQQLLTVGFLTGTAYTYTRVPASVYQGLLGAYSKGRYFHVWIRDRYRTQRVR